MNEINLRRTLASPRLRKLSGPLEHWLTTYSAGFWGLEEKTRSQWARLEPGDPCVFHAQENKFYVHRSLPRGMIVGFGIVGQKSQKVTLEWVAEIESGQNRWPYLIHFKELWWFGRVGEIAKESSAAKLNRPRAEIISELGLLSEDAVSLGELAAADIPFNPMGQIAFLAASDTQARERLAEMLVRRVATSATADTRTEADVIQDIVTRKSDPPFDQVRFEAEVERAIGEGRNFRVPDEWGRQKVRRGCSAWRKLVLMNCRERCAVCGLGVKSLLDAAHIRAWNKDPDNRLNPGNGLALCVLHHRALDRGLLRIVDGVIDIHDEIMESQAEILIAALSRFHRTRLVAPKKWDYMSSLVAITR